MKELPEEVRIKAKAINRALKESGIPYAFGGAIAFGFAATPRSTLDIDVDIFLPESDLERAIAALSPLGVSREPVEGLGHLARESQGRFDWDGTWIDLFFAFHPLHAEVSARATLEDFDGELMPVLSAEDITIFKLFFDRPKDWVDVESILAVQGRQFDMEYVTHWLTETIGSDDSRLARLQTLAREVEARTGHVD